MRRFFSSKPAKRRGQDGWRAYAVGDVHGRIDLLDDLLARIAADHASRPAARGLIVFLGDLIDRGPASAAVVVMPRGPASMMMSGAKARESTATWSPSCPFAPKARSAARSSSAREAGVTGAAPDRAEPDSAAPDWAALRTLPDEDVTQTLVALPGIGRWTAEIYLKFALGRADAFAAGDLALQEAARMMFDLPARPTPAALIEMAEPWRPWRSVAARALWAYYGTAKGREGVR